MYVSPLVGAGRMTSISLASGRPEANDYGEALFRSIVVESGGD
jgi:hypothetical protein